MPKKLSLIILICFMIAATHCQENPEDLQGVTDCIYSAKDSFNILTQLFSESSSEAVVQDFVSLALGIPDLLGNCGDEEDAKSFAEELPPICVKDMGIAANSVIKLIEETDRKVEFELDLILLKNFYDKKLQKECPFFENTDLQTIDDLNACISSVTKIRDIYDQLTKSYEKSDYNKTVDFSTEILGIMPKTFEACGQEDMAKTFREDLPERCIKSLNKFGKLVASYEECTSGIQWLFSHIFQLFSRFQEVQYTCPVFDDDIVQRIKTKLFEEGMNSILKEKMIARQA